MASAGAVQYFTIFLLYLFLFPGHPSVAETLIPTPIRKYKIAGEQENRILVSYSETIQLDAVTGGVPIINPTNPGSGTTPTVNPVDSPPAPIGTTPIPTTPPAATTSPTSSGGAWCIASPTASQTALQVALDYACGYGGADCSTIQPSGSCYNPNTLRDHASYAFNAYYQKNPVPTSCSFGGTAQLTNTDPSSGNCHYASSPTTPPSVSPPVNPAPPPPASTTMTPTIASPGGPPTVYGVPEPVGQPSSATSVSCSLLIPLFYNWYRGITSCNKTSLSARKSSLSLPSTR
ncbi:BETA-13 GLUCANASE [Salix koriyanagi]|uniref:BETA-13 GLUCANASE n=1 Tax=Salix koriyanagi TaxID=2511006 RepID=A0A9Q0WZA1_9ROSI|nr:BETA-13 GLUCANASE [Salix koriyanagi]